MNGHIFLIHSALTDDFAVVSSLFKSIRLIKMAQTRTVSSVITQQRALLHWPTAVRRGKLSCPILNPRKVAERRRGVWMDGTDRVECGRHCYYAEQAAASLAGLFNPISDELCRKPSLRSFWQSSYCDSPGSEGERWIHLTDRCRLRRTDNKWERSDHNKRQKVRNVSFAHQHNDSELISYLFKPHSDIRLCVHLYTDM